MLFGFKHPWLLLSCLAALVILAAAYRRRVKQPLPSGQSLSLWMRAAIVLILGLALADPWLMEKSDRVNLFFLFDASRSMSREAGKTARDFINRAASTMGPEDRAGLIVFGREPLLETSLSSDLGPVDIRSQVDPEYTNINQAIAAAIGRLPDAGRGRVVLLSDGNQNEQDALDAAAMAGALGIEIFAVPVGVSPDRNEVHIESMSTPPSVSLETPFEIGVTIFSRTETRGELFLLRDESLLSSKEVDLHPGRNVFTFGDLLDRPGLYLYKSAVNAPDDGVLQNNQALAFTQAEKKSQVLYLGEDRPEPSHLVRALESQGLDVAVMTTGDLPGASRFLVDYDAVVMDNVPSRTLTRSAMEGLDGYVKDFGGGLIMIGGDRSFGAGLYQNTPVEKALPVFMDLQGAARFPEICLVLVVDKSASMAGDISGRNKLEGAKIAAFSAVETLNPTDKVGLLAFDYSWEWVVPLTPAGEREEIARHLSMLREGGGTDLYYALKEAYRALAPIEAAKKHILVLSDGLTNKADFHPLVQSLRQKGITISTVAMGDHANLGLLESLAGWGGGRSYFTNDITSIPRIFVGEIQIASREVIVEKNIAPTLTFPEEMTSGLTDGGFPSVDGLVLTHPKPGAQVVLDTPEGPLLVVWQYGLGRSAAFTSDLAPRWSKDWVLWEHYGRFTSQLVRWVQRRRAPSNYYTQITRQGRNGYFNVDVMDQDDRFVNHLDLKLQVLQPSKSSNAVHMEQVAPGRYTGRFPVEETGEYFLSLFGSEDGAPVPINTFGYGVPYTDEFSVARVNRDLLERLAAQTNGQVLDPGSAPMDLFTVKGGAMELQRPLWPWLCLAAILLFVLDAAVRKIRSL